MNRPYVGETYEMSKSALSAMQKYHDAESVNKDNRAFLRDIVLLNAYDFVSMSRKADGCTEVTIRVNPLDARAQYKGTRPSAYYIDWFPVLQQPVIERVIFNNPATIVFWTDGLKTVVKANDEIFDPEKGLAMCIAKRFFGNKGNYYNTFRKYLTDDAQLMISDRKEGQDDDSVTATHKGEATHSNS